MSTARDSAPDRLNDELTIAARIRDWELFAPDWAFIREHPVLTVGALCGLSVGLHPYFSDPTWIFNVALLRDDGDLEPDPYLQIDDAPDYSEARASFREFLRRVHIAVANLEPLGALPIAHGEPSAERTLVKVSDFEAWANNRGWTLPPEFPRALPAGPATPPEPAAAPDATSSVACQARLPGRRPDSSMVLAFQEAKGKIDAGSDKSPAAREAIDKHFPEESKERKRQLTETLRGYLQPSKTPKWAK